MELQEYLQVSGYIQRLEDLDMLMGQRERFALLLRDAHPAHAVKGREALAELDAKIDAAEDRLAREYEDAVKHVNESYAQENGIATAKENDIKKSSIDSDQNIRCSPVVDIVC